MGCELIALLPELFATPKKQEEVVKKPEHPSACNDHLWSNLYIGARGQNASENNGYDCLGFGSNCSHSN
jgi:hypothetical protein